MQKELEYALLHSILLEFKKDWIKELNSEGATFNFNAQDAYRKAYEDCITKWRLMEVYPPEVLNELRIEQLDDIRITANEIVRLYEKHNDSFINYNRVELMYNTFKKRNPFYKSVPIESLKMVLGYFMDLPQQDVYYKSTFYEQYGFLLNDYHFEINMFCKYILSEIKDNFRQNNKFKNFIDNSDYAPYFPMGLVYDVYKLCNENQFKKQTELEFYKSINLLDLHSDLEIVGSEIGRVYYVLHKFTNCIKDKEVRIYWINVILHRLGKDYENNYLKRYREIVSKNVNEKSGDKLFVEKVDKIFKSYVIQ